MNAFRNLYRIIDNTNGKIVGFVTAQNASRALDQYSQNGGKRSDVKTQQLGFGFHKDLCDIYA